MDDLKRAVQAFAVRHRDGDGLAITPVAGLRLKCVEAPQGNLPSVVRPLLIVVLQGAKRMSVGREERLFSAGQAAIVSASTPIVTRIETASPDRPYLAAAVEIETTTLSDVAAHLPPTSPEHRLPAAALFKDDVEEAVLDCVRRLVRLCSHPEAVPLLHPGIMKELHYWLLSGPHGANLRTLCDPTSCASRLARAVAVLRTEYRTRIAVERLAAEAGMGLTTFHIRFKRMLSLTPGQYQKRLRLIEARRLMWDEGASASSAAFAVGYESVSQFTREYGRFFEAPPKKDTIRARPARGDVAGGLQRAARSRAL